MCYLSTLIVIVAEAASISLCALSFCFPLTAFSSFPLNAYILSYSCPNQYSCFNSFISCLTISCPDLLFYMSLYPWSSISVTRLRLVLIDFLFVNCQYCLELIRLLYSKLKKTFQNLIIVNPI